MSVYPTLCDLCKIPAPAHLDGKSIGVLLADPQAAWDTPALTTHIEGNHAVRSEGWRYIRYADGSEELYDETADPYEWTNLASRPEHAERKAELAGHLPKQNAKDVSDLADDKPGRKAAKNERRKAKRKS